MSISKFNSVMNNIQNLIDWLENKGIYGPIGYLESALGEVDNAKDEYNIYLSEGISE